MKQYIPKFQEFLNEAVFANFHPKCKSKIFKKLRSKDELVIEDQPYMIVVNGKWTDGWYLEDIYKDNGLECLMYKFVTGNGYSDSPLIIDELSLDHMMQDSFFAIAK